MGSKKPRYLKRAVLALSLLMSSGAIADVVIINASNGNTEAEVQQAVDLHPPGTTFLLTGTFNFSFPVFIEKSNITILGDMIDDGNGSPGPEDTWNTVIEGQLAAFEFSPKGGAVWPYEVNDVTISGINFKLSFATGNGFATPAPGNCELATEQYRLSGVKFENNWVQGGGLFFLQNTNELSIDNNHFSSLQDIFVNPVTLLGWTTFFDCQYVTQHDHSITNNTFDSRSNIYSGIGSGLTIVGNRMIGLPAGSGDRITLFQHQDVVVSDNYFEGDSTNTGILIFSNNLSPFPGDFSKRVIIKDNILLDMGAGITVFGGLEDSKILRNQIIQSGAFSPVGETGINIFDNASPWWPSFTNHSRNFDITNNHIADALVWGIGLNGDTSGVRMVNNSFDNPSPIWGDIALWFFDAIFGTGPAMCAAHGNKVITTNFSTEVLDGYQLVPPVGECAKLPPNKTVGTLNLLSNEIPAQAQEHFDSLRERLFNGSIGRPQDRYSY